LELDGIFGCHLAAILPKSRASGHQGRMQTMTNHPNRSRTFWLIHPRRFQNEYAVGVATTREHAEQYDDEGYHRIGRDYALSLMSRRAGNGEQLFVSVSIDGEPQYDRREVARDIRTSRVA
jgi:hypothetical protein